MPTQTGTATSSTDLLVKLSTFLVANGWTKIRGETQQTCDSTTVSARYWRIYSIETAVSDNRFTAVKRMEWRATPGGANLATNNANYTASQDNTGGGFDLVGGTSAIVSFDNWNTNWWLQYDFGTPTPIQEIVMQCAADNDAPARFMVQWSNDGFTWTTMWRLEYSPTTWSADNQTNTFTWGAAYTDPNHVSASDCRRGGATWFTSNGGFDRYHEGNDNIWCWQGPGYDAARRVYIHACNFYDLNTTDEFISWSGSINVDTSLPPTQWWNGHEGQHLPSEPFQNNNPTHNMASNGVTYWFYVNSKRFIVVTKRGADDYTMSYCGFMSAFALPDDYPFPLLIAGSSDEIDGSMSNGGTAIRDAQDPNIYGAVYRRWDGVWRYVGNHDVSLSQSENFSSNPQCVMWPKHPGVTGRANYPQALTGDHADPEGHWLNNTDPTVQGDLPVIPTILLDRDVGFIGALDGIFTVPSGSVLLPESTFTIGADTYRVFTTRANSEGNQYYCIKEV